MCLSLNFNFNIKIFLYLGDPKVALSPVDPLQINRMSIKQGGDSPVNIELNFNNVQLHGLRDFICTSLS